MSRVPLVASHGVCFGCLIFMALAWEFAVWAVMGVIEAVRIAIIPHCGASFWRALFRFGELFVESLDLFVFLFDCCKELFVHVG